MKKITVFLIACMLASQQAAAEIYKCTDANGEVHYGDKPCKGESTVFTPKAGPKVDENVEARSEKTRQLLRAYREEVAQEKQKDAELKAENEMRVENCHRARNSYQQIISAGRVYRLDKDGNRTDFTDEERAGATDRAKADIEKWCG